MKYEEKIVAFVDILGFRNIINDESNCEDIGSILKLPYVMQKEDMVKLLKLKGVAMTSISDSMVFSIRLKEHNAMNKINKIITALEQSLLSQYGLLLRGGIAVGKLYQDNEVVYGPGLVKAYELESKYAVYPRVIMLPSDFERVILSCSESSISALRKIYISDIDGFLTFDCFYYTNQQMLEECRLKLEQMKASDLKVQQKINWMITAINENTNPPGKLGRIE